MFVKEQTRESKGDASTNTEVSVTPAGSTYKDRLAHLFRKRRVVMHVGVAFGLLFVVLWAFGAVLPTSSGISDRFGQLFRPSMTQMKIKHSAVVLIAAQAATATAITQDGYEYKGAGGRYNWAGVQRTFTLPDGSMTNEMGGISSISGTIADDSFHNQFTPGQCTYWADYEYHRLTGYAVPWSGNAADWSTNAVAFGWIVSSTPHVPSIIALQPGVEGAGEAGHVGVVEKINPDGSVATTNWNVRGWGVFSWETYYPGPGVSFIWHP
jgi:surface antigen